jgi:hypothetical protein
MIVPTATAKHNSLSLCLTAAEDATKSGEETRSRYHQQLTRLIERAQRHTGALNHPLRRQLQHPAQASKPDNTPAFIR